LELLAADFGALKVFHKSSHLRCDGGGLIVKALEVSLRQIGLVHGRVKMVLNLAAGAFRVAEELDELAVAAPLEALGDVGRDGDGGPTIWSRSG
jgi:hypothetical protein